jgi:hypothetical protein
VPLPALTFAAPAEPYAALDLERGCGDPLIEQRGVSAWRDLLLSQVGGRNLGIVRACNVGSISEHKTGRAFDWGMLASDPTEKTTADTLLAELLANDAEIFRRLGLMYVIWDAQIWSVRTKSWTPYTGPNPHTDHVHFSFGWPGAKAQTSYFQALGTIPDLSRAGEDPPSAAVVAMAVGIGLGIGWYASRFLASEFVARG